MVSVVPMGTVVEFIEIEESRLDILGDRDWYGCGLAEGAGVMLATIYYRTKR